MQSDAPGKFQVALDGKPLEKVFGTEGKKWSWHDGGTDPARRRQARPGVERS